MTDGRTSGHIGTRNKLDQHYTFEKEDVITVIELLGSPGNKYCQGLRLIGHKGNPLIPTTFVECQGVDECTEWQSYKLDKLEQIVGVYGSCNSAKNMRGLGFLVWKPLEHKKPQNPSWYDEK